MFPECQKGVKTTIKDKENGLGMFRRKFVHENGFFGKIFQL